MLRVIAGKGFCRNSGLHSKARPRCDVRQLYVFRQGAYAPWPSVTRLGFTSRQTLCEMETSQEATSVHPERW